MENHGENLENETEIYSLDIILYEGSLILDGVSKVKGAELKEGYIYEFGNDEDLSDGKNYAKNTVVLKVNGDLTVKQGVTLTSISNDYGGPKGMIIYCTGTLKNDGNISMTCKGAYAKGENIYLFKNSNETFEFVPAIGGIGGIGFGGTYQGKRKREHWLDERRCWLRRYR